MAHWWLQDEQAFRFNGREGKMRIGWLRRSGVWRGVVRLYMNFLYITLDTCQEGEYGDAQLPNQENER